MQKFELQINNILNVSEQYDSILHLNSVLTVLSEYYLATAILSMAIFFSISPKIQSKSFKQTKFSLFSSISFQFNYLAILIIFFYCFLSVKQNFLFLSDFVSFNNSLHNDFISLLSKLIIGISSLVYLIFVQQFLTDQKLNYFEYYILILTSILGFCLLCCSDDLLTAYLAIELQSLAFYVLASFKRSSNYSVESGVKYFILGSFSTIIFLFGSNLIYGLSGSISIIDFKDLFIWVFSANSFFLSFESISKALESFQDKTFKLDNNHAKDLQTIYDKFLILKNNTYLSSVDLNTLLLELDSNKSFFEETTDPQKLNLYKNISQKMIQIANQIDSSSFHYYKNHLENGKEISSSIQFAKDLIIDSLVQNSAIWFLTDMQNLGNKYEDILNFKQDLYLSNSDLSDKFKYNWFFIENPTTYSDDLEHMSSILTKNQTVNNINEFFYFNHLSHNLDILQSANSISDLSNKNFETFSEKLVFISDKLKLFDSDFKNLVINEDLKLNYEKEKLAHLKIIAKKFELFGPKTTLSLQEVKSIFSSSKDLLASNFYTSEKAKLYEIIANNMKSNYIQDTSVFSSRIEQLKNSSEFEFLILNFKSSFLELKKVINGCINALNCNNQQFDYLVESLDLSLLEKNLSFTLLNNSGLEDSCYNFTLINKFYNLDFESILFAYSHKLLDNNEKIDVSHFSQIDPEKYYSIYEKCVNTFSTKSENDMSCLQIVNNDLVNLLTSKKTWVVEPELMYYKNLALIFNYMLYYLEPSEFYDSFKSFNSDIDYKNNLELILYKLEIFGKQAHLSLKETEVLFSLLNKENIDFNEIFSICSKISNQIQIIISQEKNNFDNWDELLALRFNNLKQIESFKNFELAFSNALIVLNKTVWAYFQDTNQLSTYNDLLEKYGNTLSIISLNPDIQNFSLIDYVISLTKREISNVIDEIYENFLTEQSYLAFLKDLTVIFNYLPYFLSSNEIYDNFSLLPKYLSDEQKSNCLSFIILKLKNSNENLFLSKWEFEFLINEMKDILNNGIDLEKKKLYLELSKILSSFDKPYSDILFSKPDSLSKDNSRPVVSEILEYYFNTKELLLESKLKHDIMSKTLASLYLDTNLYSQYNIIKPSETFLIDSIKYSPYNINQQNESLFMSVAHILTLCSLFFDFSYSSNETSNFIFDTALIELGVLIVLISLFFKLALSPFHLWSPDVYEGSPSSSTFFFTVISKLSIFVFLLKICYIGFYSIIVDWQLYSLIVAVISILVGSIGGLKQRKFKSILAYSSISNMGLILVSFSAGNFEGIKAFFYFFILYILSGLAVWSIFLLLKLKKKIPSEKHNKDLGDFSLLHELNVILAYASVITIFTVAGIPPMVGFLAKVSIFLSLTEASMYCIALISILASVISTFFYLRVLKVIFFENVLVGKLFYPTNSKDNIIRSLLFFLLLFLFISPVLPSFFAYKTTLFLNKNFY